MFNDLLTQSEPTRSFQIGSVQVWHKNGGFLSNPNQLDLIGLDNMLDIIPYTPTFNLLPPLHLILDYSHSQQRYFVKIKKIKIYNFSYSYFQTRWIRNDFFLDLQIKRQAFFYTVFLERIQKTGFCSFSQVFWFPNLTSKILLQKYTAFHFFRSK